MSDWILKTDGDPVLAVQHFLYDLWPYAGVEGMLVQLEPYGEDLPAPTLVEDPNNLLAADPFIPVAASNAAMQVNRLAAQNLPSRLAAVLRPCEVRALHLNGNRDRWLIIGHDCMGSFPAEDYPWRQDRAGGPDRLTRSELSHARQGRISERRLRNACQMCTPPPEEKADLWIGLVGLPVRQHILVRARDEATAERLRLPRLTQGRAAPDIVQQREHVLASMAERHANRQERLIQQLKGELPFDPQSWKAHLESCLPCQECLKACPACGGEAPEGIDQVRDWLAKCIGCGMCEQACQHHLPLVVLHARTLSLLQSEAQPA